MKNLKKIDMIKDMVDDNYPDIWVILPTWIKRRKTLEQCKEWLLFYCQYHQLKERIFTMYKEYLEWKPAAAGSTPA